MREQRDIISSDLQNRLDSLIESLRNLPAATLAPVESRWLDILCDELPVLLEHPDYLYFLKKTGARLQARIA